MVSTPTLQADLSADPSSAVYAQIYSTFESRYSNAPLNAAWTPCATPEPSAVGCQQTAGQGMNYALQVNFTCPGTAGDEVTLGMTVDVNTYSQYINVDDMDVEFIAVNGEIVEGNIDESEWYEANDNIWGDWYSFNNNNNDNNNENENDNDSDDDNNNDNGYIGSQFAAIGQAAGSGQISGEQAGEMFREQGEAMG